MLARLLFFFRNRPQVLPLLPSTLKTLTASTSTTATDAAPNDAVSTNPKDDYFAAIHHVSNIVRRDFYLERTLNKLRLHVTSELVFRVLRACSSSPTECHRFFNWARTQTNYRPTTVEFEELIQTLARSRKYETMWKLLHQMKSLSLSPSPDTMSFLIEQYGKHGLVDNAVEIFNKSEKSLNCPQTLELYNALLFSLCESKLFNGAYALIRRMVRKGLVPNKRTYAILVNAWCSAGKMREAQQFLAEMSRKGFNPPVRGRDLLIEGLLNAGYLECAKGIVTKMAKQGFVPDVATFNLLIESICKSGEVEFCLNLYNKVRGSGLSPDINTYKILIPAVSKAGRVDEAFRLLNDAVEYGHKPFPSLYAPVMKAMCRKGQFDDAFCFFSDMKAKGHPPNRPVYTMLITMCGRGGRFVEAANYLVEMTELGLAPISRCFDMVTDGLKNCGKHDLAQRIEQLEKSQYALAEAEMIDYDSSMKCGIMESAVSDHQEQIGGSGHAIEFWYQRAWYYCFSIFKGCQQNALQSLLIESLYFCSNCFVEVDLLRWEYGYVCVNFLILLILGLHNKPFNKLCFHEYRKLVLKF